MFRLYVLALIVSLITGCFFANPGNKLTVIRIADGDTLTLRDANGAQTKVRLGEIDAPERGQDYGQRAKEALKELCLGKEAVLETQDIDRYGRTVGWVHCNGVAANAEMVANGYAWVYDRHVRDNRLYGLQEKARSQKLGLWHQPEPEPPWEYRRNRR